MTAPFGTSATDHRTARLRADSDLARVGRFRVALARGQDVLAAAQALRQRVFFAAAGRDADRFDPACDHLVVLDTSAPSEPVVGTCRLLPRHRAGRTGFCSAGEFAVSPLIARHPGLSFCEVGRACIAPRHRSRMALEALWAGLWAYARGNAIDVYFGTASFPGLDADAHALALSYLHHRHRAPADWDVAPHADAAVAMDRMPPGAIEAPAALRALPPLIRGYLRLDAHVGSGAYADRRLGTIDVMIVSPVARMPGAYRRHFDRRIGVDESTPARVGIAPVFP